MCAASALHPPSPGARRLGVACGAGSPKSAKRASDGGGGGGGDEDGGDSGDGGDGGARAAKSPRRVSPRRSP